MTKLKKALIVAASLVLVVTLATVGILAATQQSLTVTSTISFEATGVRATAEIVNATNNGVPIAGITKAINGGTATAYSPMQWEQNNNTVDTPVVFNLGTLAFVRNEVAGVISFGTIAFDILITNNGGTTLTIGFTEPTIAPAANVTASYTYLKNGATVTRTTMTGVATGGTATIKVVLSVTNPVKDVPSTPLTFAGTITPSN